MKFIRFGRWNGHSGMFFRYERIYTRTSNFIGRITCNHFGCFSPHWTPIVTVTKRYSTWFGCFKKENKW